MGSNPTKGVRFGSSSQRVGGYGLTARRRIPDPKIGGSNPSSLTFLLVSPSGGSRLSGARLRPEAGKLAEGGFDPPSFGL